MLRSGFCFNHISICCKYYVSKRDMNDKSRGSTMWRKTQNRIKVVTPRCYHTIYVLCDSSDLHWVPTGRFNVNNEVLQQMRKWMFLDLTRWIVLGNAPSNNSVFGKQRWQESTYYTFIQKITATIALLSAAVIDFICFLSFIVMTLDFLNWAVGILRYRLLSNCNFFFIEVCRRLKNLRLSESKNLITFEKSFQPQSRYVVKLDGVNRFLKWFDMRTYYIRHSHFIKSPVYI